MEPNQLVRIVYVSSGAELLRTLGPQGVDLKLNLSENYAVFPYFSDYHTFSLLKIRGLAEHDEVQTVQISPARYSYFGLPSCLPGQAEARVYGDALDAAANYSHAGVCGKYGTGCLQVHFNLQADNQEFKPKLATFLMSGKDTFNSLVRTRNAFEEFQVADLSKTISNLGPLTTVGWRNYVFREFSQMAGNEGRLTPQLVGLMETLKTDQPTLDWLKHRIGAASPNHAQLLLKLNGFLNQHDAWVMGDVQISETHSGFKARRIKTGLETYFTNFLVKIDRNLWFESTTEMYHAGRIVINQTAYPVCLPHSALSRAQELEQFAVAAVMRGSQDEARVVPTITDTTFRAKFLAYLNHKSALAPRVSGVDRLGWNSARTQFCTPTWQADTQGVRPTSQVAHPRSEYLSQHYSFQGFSHVKHTEQVSSEVKYFAALLVAMICRAYLKLPCPAIRVLRNTAGVQLLHALFRTLGQTEISEINPNIRGSTRPLIESRFDGYPVFTYCSNPRVVEQVSLPMFLLSDSGIPFHGLLGDEIYPQVCTFSHQLITKVVLGLLRDGRKSHDLVTVDIPEVIDLVFEGKRAAERYAPDCSLDIFPHDLPRFKSLLTGIPFEALNRFFRFDLSAQTIRMNFRQLKGTSRERIVEELKSRNAEIRLHPPRYVNAPVNFMQELLSSFYNRPVRLFASEESAFDAEEDEATPASNTPTTT